MIALYTALLSIIVMALGKTGICQYNVTSPQPHVQQSVKKDLRQGRDNAHQNPELSRVRKRNLCASRSDSPPLDSIRIKPKR